MTRLLVAVGVLLAVSAGGRPGFGPRMAEAAPEALITPFMLLYAIHDAVVERMPAGPNTPKDLRLKKL